MIRDEQLIRNNLEKIYEKSHLIYDKLFDNYYYKYISNFIDFDIFWEDNKQELLDLTYENYGNSKLIFREHLINFIDNKINDFLIFSEDFNEFLNMNHQYNIYFNWLKKFLLFYFNSFELDHFHGYCIYEMDVEDPARVIVKIKLLLPTKDYILILDLLEDFLKQQEARLYETFSNYENKELIFNFFKRTYFIFRSMYCE